MRTIENLIMDKKLAEQNIALIMEGLYKKYPEFDVKLSHCYRNVVTNCYGKIERLSSETIITVSYDKA